MSSTKKVARKSRKRTKSTLMKKAPGAPKRFKSSYIHFFMHVHDKVKSSLPSDEATAPLISKIAAKMWRNLPAAERKYWIDLAANEKKVYFEQKDTYRGPWKVPNRRAKKDPTAPKRNPSAFLLFASTRRNILQQENPHLDNTFISRMLGREWRTMPPATKGQFIDRELAERALYHEKVIQWKREKGLEKIEGEEVGNILSLPIQVRDSCQDNQEKDEGEKDDDSNFLVDSLLKTVSFERTSPVQKDSVDATPASWRPSSCGSRYEKEIASDHDVEPCDVPSVPLNFPMVAPHSFKAIDNFQYSPSLFCNDDSKASFCTYDKKYSFLEDAKNAGVGQHRDQHPHEINHNLLYLSTNSEHQSEESYLPAQISGFRPNDLEGSSQHLKEVYAFHKDKPNGNMVPDGDSSSHKMHSNPPKDFLTSLRLPFEFPQNESPNSRIKSDGSIEKLINHEDKYNRKPDMYDDLQFHETNPKPFDFSSVSRTLPFQTSHFLKDTSSLDGDDFERSFKLLCNDDFETSFRRLEERLGLR